MLEHVFDKAFYYDWAGANGEIFLGINGIRGVGYDKFMVMVSRAFDTHNFFYYVGAVGVWAVLNLLLRSITRRPVKPYFAIWFGILCVLMFGFFTQIGLINAMKSEFSYPRPYLVYSPSEISLIDYEHDPGNDNQSFPSGHVAFTTLLVVGLWPGLSTLARWLGVFLIPLVGWSRISLGMHFPADVIAGFLVSFVLILIIRATVYRLLRSFFGMRC